MFVINYDMSIYITRGDIGVIGVSAIDNNGEKYKFKYGDVVRFKVTEKNNCENVIFQKDTAVNEHLYYNECETVYITLSSTDTKIGDVISKPTDYWYEVELNPYTNPQTIVGYDDLGAKILKLYPEGKDVEPTQILPEDIPVVDTELDITSDRPVQNQAIARAIMSFYEEIEGFRGVIQSVKNIDEHINSRENPHYVTKEQLGLEFVENTKDEDKNVASANSINSIEIYDAYTVSALKEKIKPYILDEKYQRIVIRSSSEVIDYWNNPNNQETDVTGNLRYTFNCISDSSSKVRTFIVEGGEDSKIYVVKATIDEYSANNDVIWGNMIELADEKYVDEKISTLTSSLNEKVSELSEEYNAQFFVKQVEVDLSLLGAEGSSDPASYMTHSETLKVTGYSPIGIIGWNSTGTNGTNMFYSRMYLDSNGKLQVIARNFSGKANASDSKLIISTLWQKDI